MNAAVFFNNPKLQFSLLSAGCWLCSLAFALMPLAAYEAESFLLSAVLLGLAVIASIIVAPVDRINALGRSSMFWGLMAFWLLALVSVVMSEVAAISFLYFVFFSALPLSFILFSTHDVSGVLLKACMLGAGLILSGLAAFAAVSYYFLPDFLIYNQVHWPLSNPNSFAGLMSYGFWGAVGVCVFTTDLRFKVLSAAHVLLFFSAMLMTGSVGALLALILVIPVFLSVLWRYLKGKKAFILALFAGCAVLISVFTLPVNQIRSVSGEATSGIEALSSRPAIWASTVEIFQDNLWTGTGIGTFFLYYPEVRSPEDPSTAGLMVHNDPLQFTAEMGVMGPVVFYLLALTILIKTCKVMVSNGFGGRDKVIVFTCFSALVSMVLHTHVTFHFNVLSMLMLTGLLLAYLNSRTCTCFSVGSEPEDSYTKPIMKSAFLLPAIIMLAFFSQLQASQVLVNQMQRYIASGDIDAAIAQVNRADKIGFGTNARAYVAAANIHIGILQLNAPLMPKEELATMVMDVRELLDKAQRHNPRSAEILHARGELRTYTEPFLREEDRIHGKKAHELFEDALKLDPLHLSSRLKLVDAALRSKNFDQALVLLEEGLQWRYKAQNPRFFLEKAERVAKQAGREDVYEQAKQQWGIYFNEPYPVESE